MKKQVKEKKRRITGDAAEADVRRCLEILKEFPHASDAVVAVLMKRSEGQVYHYRKTASENLEKYPLIKTLPDSFIKTKIYNGLDIKFKVEVSESNGVLKDLLAYARKKGLVASAFPTEIV